MFIPRIQFSDNELFRIKKMIAEYGQYNDSLNSLQSQASEIQTQIEEIEKKVRSLQEQETLLLAELETHHGKITLAEIRAAVNPDLPY